MSLNRYRIYDIVQRTITTGLLATTVLGGGFIGLNVYNNWVEKQRLQAELLDKKMVKGEPEKKS